MKLMDRYIIRELIVPFIAGSVTIALLFAANQLIFIMKTFNVENVPPVAMVQMIVYKMPFWLNMTLPAGISLAASLALTRLSRESEITAMRASGVRVLRVVLPVALFGFVVALGNFYLVEKILPIAEQKANKIQVEVGAMQQQPLRSRVWLSLRQYSVSIGEVKSVRDDTLELKNIVLGEIQDSDTVTFTAAPTGTYRHGVWTFDNIEIWQISPKAMKFTPISGDKLIVTQTIYPSDIFAQGELPLDKSSGDLIAEISAGKKIGRDMTREEIQLHERFSVPAACIVFAIIAPIFAIVFAKTGSFAGVMLSFIMVLLYYNAFVISTDIFGKNHWVSPWLAAWLPNFVFAALGLLGVRRLE
jgi:lipopolysaccharide export system permease protein